MHFSDLKKDMAGEIRKIADFLDIPINEDKWDDILLHCSFDYMKEHSSKSVPMGGAFWDGGSKTFINKGVNGVWAEVLTDEQNKRYESKAIEELGDECAQWLKSGNSV